MVEDRIRRAARLAAGAALVALAVAAFAGLAVAAPGGWGASAAQYQYGPAGKQYGKQRMPVCHKGRTLWLPAPAIRAHLRHGDTAGACTTSAASAKANAKGKGKGKARGRR